MANSLLKRMIPSFRSRSEARAETINPVVDISRVIPGYKPVGVAAQDVSFEAPPLPHTEESLVSETKPQAGLEETAEQAVADLSDRHDEWVQADLARLSGAMTNAREAKFTTEKVDELKLVAHNLKGMATSYGHPGIARLSASLCSLLERSNSHTQAGLINLHVEACRAAYHEASTIDGTSEIANAVCDALETQVNQVR